MGAGTGAGATEAGSLEAECTIRATTRDVRRGSSQFRSNRRARSHHRAASPGHGTRPPPPCTWPPRRWYSSSGGRLHPNSYHSYRWTHTPSHRNCQRPGRCQCRPMDPCSSAPQPAPSSCRAHCTEGRAVRRTSRAPARRDGLGAVPAAAGALAARAAASGVVVVVAAPAAVVAVGMGEGGHHRHRSSNPHGRRSHPSTR